MSEEEGKAIGRPLKFQSVDDLSIKIDAYFGECDPHVAKRKIVKEKANGTNFIGEEEYITDQIPYTITGLALALDTNRQTLINYSHEAEFFDTIARAKLRCEQFAEQHLYTGKTPAGAVFNLKNNYGWKDESTVFNPGAVIADMNGLDKLNKDKESLADKAQEALDGASVPGAE